ncbi:C1-like, partial [Parasponia andersonii]
HRSKKAQKPHKRAKEQKKKKKKEEYKHFSHPHYLKTFQLQNGDVQPNCSGCESSILSGSAYGCYSCNSFSTSNARRPLDHPSHRLHHLTLLPYPAHPNGAHTCDACGLDGTAASYSCPLCDFDVHVPRALLAQTLENPSAHPRELMLSYALPLHGDK